MVNKAYAELVKFDNEHHNIGVHQRLKIYVNKFGTRHLSYYLAKLSHEIYKSHGSRGHDGRINIRNNLRRYAYTILNNSHKRN